MSNIEDGKDVCVVEIGYTSVVMPKKAALLLFSALSEGRVMALDTKWDDVTKTSYEVFKKVEVTLRAMPEEDYALRKLQTHAWDEQQKEKENNKVPF